MTYTTIIADLALLRNRIAVLERARLLRLSVALVLFAARQRFIAETEIN